MKRHDTVYYTGDALVGIHRGAQGCVLAVDDRTYTVDVTFNGKAVRISQSDVANTPCAPAPGDRPATAKNPNPKDSIGSSKLPIHLWPGVATAYGCLGLLDGAAKYGRGNYRTSEVRFSIYYDAAMRHMFKLMAGEDKDKDSGLPHEAHILACMAIIVDARAAGTLLDDRDAASGFNDVLADLTAHVPRLTALHADKNPRHYTIKDNDAKQTRKPD